ncbi:MAG: hypothetical protein NT075_20990, partial [Chloroflexi bacterium]|nr:hypothetical protein [Chloroflexota bacterium]
MSSTLERLRRLQELRPQRAHPDPEVPTASELNQPLAAQPTGVRQLEVLVPGLTIENSAGICYMRTQIYPLHIARGERPLGDLLVQRPSLFAPYHPTFGLHDQLDFRQAAFIDTETTGLGGGAGVYCFMVGVGTFEGKAPGDPATPTEFVVRQFFMRNPAEEGALLIALA